jgi:hypothetical protein
VLGGKMPITFASIDDPYGLRGASSTLAQAIISRAAENRADQRQLGLEQRAENRQISSEERMIQRQLEAEKKQQEARQQYGTILGDALKVVQDPNASQTQKIGALQQYAAISGDQKSVAPILNQILKQGARQEEAQASLNFLKQMGVDVPESISPENLPPASFLSNFAQGLKPTFEPESDKIEAKRSADLADRVVMDYNAAETSKNRLAQMDIAAKSGQLPSPAMVKLMDFYGVPLSVFTNPLAETYEKNVNEYIKDISNYFPGQIRVAEIEPYMKTIPTLMNSDAGKELIIQNQQLINEQKIAAYDAYKQILKENKGRKPKNLDIEILERTKDKRETISEKLKENFEKAVQMTKYNLGRVSSGTKLTPTTALNYLKAANGDRKKAEDLARKDGYEF